MQKKYMAAVLLSASALPAIGQAQSSVQVYGLIDATIRSINNTNAKGDSIVGFQTPWFSGSRLGFQGREDLGNGLAAVFKLESEYVIGTGAMDTPGVLFNRDSWIGLESKELGQVRIGRQNTLARDFAQIYGDAYGSAKLNYSEGGFSNTNNFKQLVYYAGSDTGTRYDNGIVWKKIFSNGVVAGLGYKLGEVPGDFSRNTTKSAAIGYNGENYVVSTFVNEANVNNMTHRSYSLGGSYMFPAVRVSAGYFHYTAEQPVALGERKDNAWTISTKLTPGGALDYAVGYVNFNVKNGAYNSAGTGLLNPYASTTTATASGSGKKDTIYGSIMYHFSKRTEMYVVADYMKLRDGFRVATAAGNTNQTEFAVGMRTHF
ncbi:porin [Rugamonas apoptosis]|uniref:Porin n=1 Tax=Rugamonas apoptosis TaxID=2758570 RepID=A0A7W2INB1_9BURK|nr:porin [Rugamonas apoptosis]MBA5690660.1 porin [Rugamonas apoptosis]